MNEDTKKRVLILVACLLIATVVIIVCYCIRANKEQSENVDPIPTSSQNEAEVDMIESESVTKATQKPENTQSIDQENEASEEPKESEIVPESEPVDETRKTSEPKQPVGPVINPSWSAPPIISEQPVETLQPVKNATVKINNQESIFGEPLKDLDFTIVSGNATYEEVEKVIKLTKDPGNEVGSYRINVEFTNNNMGIILISEATYTIKARPVTIKVYNRSSEQGKSLISLKMELVNGSLAKGNTLSNVVEITTEADKNRVGRYEIKTRIKNENYDVTLIDENGKLIDNVNKVWYNVTSSGSTVYNPENNPSDPPVNPSNKPINPGPGGEGGEEEKPPEEGTATTPPNPGPGGEGGEEEKLPEEGTTTTPPNPGPGGEGGEEEMLPEEGTYT